MGLAYSSQSKRRNFINEVIEEEDEEKNKEKELRKEREKNKNRHNPDKFLIKNNKKKENILDEKHQKGVLIWSNSQLNKKTYENLFYKKTFDKYVPVREQLIGENKNSNIMPELNTQQSLKTSMTNKNNLRSKSIEKVNLQKSKNTYINNNINSTNDTSAFTHSSKKYFSPRAIYTQNYTEDLSKFRLGLLSAGSSSNNNVIIPMIPFRRPVSNFNFGTGQLWNNFENKNNIKENNEEENDEKNNIKVKEKNENKNEKEINKDNSKNNYNIYNKMNSATINNKQEMKKRLELFQSKKDINNLYIGLDKMITKLHKIKIEKGMMNSGIINSLNKKFSRDFQNQIEQFKKSHLPMMFDNNQNKISNNIEKNKLRSHSFNNKNIFY